MVRAVLPLLWPVALPALSLCFSSWLSHMWRPSSFSRAWIRASYCRLLSVKPSPRWSGMEREGSSEWLQAGGWQPPGPASPVLTSALLEEQLHALLVLLLLPGKLAVHLQALPFKGHLQPVHQPLLLLQLHLQLREGDLLLVLLLPECHYLCQGQQAQPATPNCPHETLSWGSKHGPNASREITGASPASDVFFTVL